MSDPQRPVVAINTLAVNPSNAGSRTMLTGLIPALARVAPHFRLLLVCHAENRELYDPDLEAIELDPRSGQVFRRVLYDLFRVSKVVEGRADVLVTPGNVGPLRCAIPQVAVVAAHLVLPSAQEAALPERMPWLKVKYLGWPFRRYLRGADQVLGISEYVAQGVVDELGIDPGKVRAMPLGFTPPEGGPTLEGRGNTILFVGTLYRYKDGDTAVRAFAKARPQLPADARLVIAGKDHAGGAAALAAVAEECGVTDGVDIVGPVSPEELDRLFRTSGVLLMPSKCEGFGLPVAEAMGYGLPVIAADATALPGVAGGAARLVPVADVDGFAQALVDILGNPERRQAMAAAGVTRAAELTWEAGAIQLRDAIEEALAGRAPSRIR
ncbi:MAG: glycosyltransferase family 4 protein [Actinomycetota bacterium]|nr:glycosyltransferase family 4 protein [Actinomycetota bacterium]